LSFATSTLAGRTDSEDGLASKLLFRLADGQLIETVLMHYLDPADEEEPVGTDGVPAGRHTVCLSTQAGCAMGCVFCATGQMGLVRNLSRGECVEQLVWCARHLAAAGQAISNVVFMGMGEPLANWPGTWGTVETLVDRRGWALSPRRLTISTVGIVPGIRRLAATEVPVRLAVSLHAPDDALRSRLVPVNEVYGLDEILVACREYQFATGRRITFEYVLIDGVNDRPDQARALARRLAGLRAHVNIIPVNPTAGSGLATPSYATSAAFESALRAAGVATTLRMRRGIEIGAGCGQLRSRAAEGRLGRALPVVG
jgi:23S rRNA (adenine2503-C2)-methyltransferase